MKKYFIPLLLSIGFPLSVSATNYLECEAISRVIVRNETQMKKASESAVITFEWKKISEKYPGYENCYDFPYDSYKHDECLNYQKKVTTVFKDEALNYIAEKQKPYKDIEKRATNDFKKRGCYWF